MMSMLFCRFGGGIIDAEDSGQSTYSDYGEEFTYIDRDGVKREAMKRRLVWGREVSR